MNTIKKVSFTLLILLTTYIDASPFDLGSAGQYTIVALNLSMGPKAAIVLGSGARVEGNVGTQCSIVLGTASVITGNLDGRIGGKYCSIELGSFARVEGDQNFYSNRDYWKDQVRDDIALARAKASSGVVDPENNFNSTISSSTTLISNDGITYFNFRQGLNLGSGEMLSFEGQGQFVINVEQDFVINPGGGMELNGVNGGDVLINFVGGGEVRVNGEGSYASVFGILLGPQRTFVIGDGVIQNETMYVVNQLISNAQRIAPPIAPCVEPPIVYQCPID